MANPSPSRFLAIAWGFSCLLIVAAYGELTDSEWKAADAAINTAYQSCLRTFPSRSQEKLRVAQRAWIVFSNKDEEAAAVIGGRAGVSTENMEREALKEVVARTEQLNSFFRFPNQDLNSCRADWEQAERELTAAYQLTMAGLAPNEQGKLREAERAWIDYKERNARAHSGDPSGRAPVWAEVVVIRRRTEQFRDFYLAIANSRGQTPQLAAIPANTTSTGSVPVTPSASPTPPSLDPAIKARVVADFKEETREVFSHVATATGGFPEVSNLAAVKKLPTPVSERIDKLTQRARDFRGRLGYGDALHECPVETVTVDALQVANEATQSIAAADYLAAGSQVSSFLQTNPEPGGEEQKPLWKFLKSIGLLCTRQQKDADTHIRRGESSLSAGKTSDAIKEYQEAYGLFPNPQTAAKIKDLQDSSLGL